MCFVVVIEGSWFYLLGAESRWGDELGRSFTSGGAGEQAFRGEV